MKERETGQLERKRSKELKLRMPEEIADLGFSAEGPVFVSPRVFYEEECAECGVKYALLVYHVGVIVKAHHFHEYSHDKIGGGIYYSEEEFTSDWVAIVEPVGPSVTNGFSGRSEQVRVNQIKA